MKHSTVGSPVDSPVDKTGTHSRAIPGLWLPMLMTMLLSLAGQTTQAETSLWKISHGQHILYLGGTIHVLRQSDYPLPAAYQQAFEHSSLVGFETDLRQINSRDFQQLLLAKTRYPAGENLADHLSPEAFQALQRYCDDAGIAVAALLPFKPAIAMLTMMNLELARQDITGIGVDNYFLQQAEAAGKPVLGLESAEKQLDFIVSMGEGKESEFILHSLQDLQQLGSLLQQMIDQWRSGNSRALDRLFVAPLAQEYPAIYQTLLVERNQAWLPKIEQLLQTEGTELVLIGVAHLVGADGLIQQLEQRGYQVEQL